MIYVSIHLGRFRDLNRIFISVIARVNRLGSIHPQISPDLYLDLVLRVGFIFYSGIFLRLKRLSNAFLNLFFIHNLFRDISFKVSRLKLKKLFHDMALKVSFLKIYFVKMDFRSYLYTEKNNHILGLINEQPQVQNIQKNRSFLLLLILTPFLSLKCDSILRRSRQMPPADKGHCPQALFTIPPAPCFQHTLH